MPEPTRAHAATAADAADPALRSRTYAVPFDQVWQEACRLLSGGLRGWTLVHADDHEGVIEAVARGITGGEHAVTVRIGLDADAQTYVHAAATARKDGIDFGRARRRLRRLLSALDTAVARMPRAGGVGREA
jgi:hypothetical protein